jgi:hypothetical protein
MTRSFSRLIVGFLLVCFFAVGTSAQRVVPIRDEPLRLVDYSGDMLTFIKYLPSTFHISCGFEIDPFEPRSSLTFRVTDATLDDVMNAIVNAKPNYQWRRNGGTIELFPLGRSHPLLDTRISALRITDMKVNEALRQLLANAEVKTAALSFGLRLTPIVSPIDNDTRFSIADEDITLRQALSRIAESSGLKFWTFEVLGPNRDPVWIRVGSDIR